MLVTKLDTTGNTEEHKDLLEEKMPHSAFLANNRRTKLFEDMDTSISDLHLAAF